MNGFKRNLLLERTTFLTGRQYEIRHNMKKEIPIQKKIDKIPNVPVVFVVDLNYKFLLSKGLEENFFRKKPNVNIDIVHRCQIQHGVN